MRWRLKARGSRQQHHVFSQPPASSLEPRAGFTLVELLVVIGLIGLILATSMPALTRQAENLRLQATTREVVGLLSLARSLAISTHDPHAVVVDAAQRRLTIVNQASGELLDHVIRSPSSITVEVQVAGQPAQGTPLEFQPSGALTGRSVTIALATRQKRRTIAVTGVTGAIVVQE